MSKVEKPIPHGLSFDDGRAAAVPKQAATVLIARPAQDELELFCVVRSSGSTFMGGAMVFPGGKLDPADSDPAWLSLAEGSPSRSELLTDEPLTARALAVAALRETLEEAGVLGATLRPALAAEVSRTRAGLASGLSFAALLADTQLRLDLAVLVPFARWVTPEAEARRYDTRFYLLPMPADQEALHDGHETTRGFWASPTRALAMFEAGEVMLAPPTTRCLELLRGVRDWQTAVTLAGQQSLLPICPRFVPGDPPALALPGHAAHEVAAPRVAGPNRFVLRDGRFVSED